jgi:hypothetical protein
LDGFRGQHTRAAAKVAAWEGQAVRVEAKAVVARAVARAGVGRVAEKAVGAMEAD